MKEQILICYSFDRLSPVKRKQFDRKLFGTTEKTHNGKYTSITKGVLSNTNYEKPIRSAIIIQKKHLDVVLNVLKSYNAKISAYIVKNYNITRD
ncbi:MAG: hypothetical protein V1859_07525 [archaeon]